MYEEKNLCFILARHPVASLPLLESFFTDLGTQLLSGFPQELEPVALQESPLEPRLEALGASVTTEVPSLIG